MSALGVFLVATGGRITDLTVPLRLVPSAYLLALATYLYNDITDYKTDTVNDRKTVQNLEGARKAITVQYTVAFFIVSILLAFSINVFAGLASVAFAGLAIAYSHPRTHLKDMFVVKTAVTGGGAFIASMMGCLASGTFSSLGFMASLIAFLFYFILGPLGDIGDLKGDKEAGRRTLPIVIGVKKSLMVMTIAAFAILSVFVAANMAFGINQIGEFVGIGIVAFILSRIFLVSKIHSDKIELSRCRKSIRYCIFACQVAMLLGAIWF